MKGSAIRILTYLRVRHAFVNDLKMLDTCLVEDAFADDACVPEI